MGIYLRKSLSVGPLRFNLSNSGIGVSAGIKGLRVGTGPRGNYVQIGRGALRYRTSLSPGRSDPAVLPAGPQPLMPTGSHEPLQEIESGDVLAMSDSSATDLLAELNTKRRLSRRSPLVLALTIVAFVVGIGLGLPLWLVLAMIAGGCALIWAVRRSDDLRRSVVLFYELAPELERPYEQLMNAVAAMASCAKTWHIEAHGRIADRKYHGGASGLVRRQPTRIASSSPPFVKTNIATVAVWVGRQVLYFFPDRILVFGPDGVGAISYRDLSVNVYPQRFIEDGGVPTDAQVVDRTWQYVNKSGGPDRRFKNNRQLPVCLYEELHFASASGLNEVIQLSRQGSGKDLGNALRDLAAALPPESAAATS
jgi:hypothetical protein